MRHRGKIEAAIANARGTLALREAGTPLEEARLGAPAEAAARGPEEPQGLAGHDPGVGRALEGAEARRLPLRRPDDRLRRHAGVRRRQRPPRDLLRPRTRCSGRSTQLRVG